MRRGKERRLFWCWKLGRMEARKAGQGVLLWSTGAAIAGVCWREHHTASSPWQQPTTGAHAKTLGQQSHNPLVRVTDEGRGLRSIARVFWICINSGWSAVCFDETSNKSEKSSHVCAELGLYGLYNPPTLFKASKPTLSIHSQYKPNHDTDTVSSTVVRSVLLNMQRR